MAVAATPARRTKRRWNPLVEWVVVIAVALGAAFVVRTFVFQQYVIDGPSMRPTLQPGDRVLLNKLSYDVHDVNRGDVVVFDRVQGTQHDDLIKRVIALEGETIRIENCVVFVDDATLDEPYLADDVRAGRCGTRTMAPLTVPDGEVFVMGDNRRSRRTAARSVRSTSTGSAAAPSWCSGRPAIGDGSRRRPPGSRRASGPRGRCTGRRAPSAVRWSDSAAAAGPIRTRSARNGGTARRAPRSSPCGAC